MPRTQNQRTSSNDPPRLRMQLGTRLKILLLGNCIPLAVLAWMGWRVARGDEWRLADGVDGRRLVLTLAALLISCIILAVSAWVLRPVGRWLRDYPDWCMRHRSAATWAIPAGLGWLAWFGLMVLAWSATLAAVVIIVTGLWELGTQAWAVHQGRGSA